MSENPERGDKDRRSIEIDPAVASLIEQGKQRQEERSLSPDDRRRLAKQRAKESQRNRKIFDLPEAITARLEQLAAEIGCPESQIAAFLLAHGLQELEDEAIQLTPYLQPSRSPRYRFNLQIPGIEEES